MKKRQIFTIVTCAIAALFLTGVLVAGLAAEPSESAPASKAARTHTNSELIDLEEYDIDSLDINWLTGPVTVGVSSDNKIHVTERSAKALSESERMTVDEDAGTLVIRWDSQWFRKFFNVDFGWFGRRDKELEVLLPKEVAEALVAVEVENVSDTLSVTGCTVESMTISTVSGTLELSSCAAETLNANTVSGSIELSGVTASEDASLNTVSGDMELTGLSAGELTLDTVSGSCKFSGQADGLSVNTISGDVTADLKVEPREVDMDSVSGGLKLELPVSAGFTVKHDSVSGNFECAFKTEELGGGRLRCGSGGADITMNTTSGNMMIKRREL